MLPLSSTFASLLSHLRYTNALLAFSCGVMCMVALSGPLASLILLSNSLLWNGPGVSIINLLSPAGGETLSYKSQVYSLLRTKRATVVFQLPSGECHPLLPGPSYILLMYTQFFLSPSVYSAFFFVATVFHSVAWVVFCVFWVGGGAPGRASVTYLVFITFGGGVLRDFVDFLVAVFVLTLSTVLCIAFTSFFAVSLAVTNAAYLLSMSSADSFPGSSAPAVALFAFLPGFNS